MSQSRKLVGRLARRAQHLKRRAVDRLLPPGTPRRQATANAIKRLKGQAPPRIGLTYEAWIRQTELRTLAPVRRYDYNPLISIVVPGYNPPDRYLEPLLDCLIAQTYPHWELVLVQGSTDPDRIAAIRAAPQRDSRIRVAENPGTNKHIVANTNIGLAAATGEYVAFMDQDDILPPHALNEVAAVLQDRPEVDFFYTDEDKLSDDGQYRSLPFFKPDWSPALIATVNYISHLSVMRRSLVEQVGGLHTGFDGSQDYDLILRVLDLSPVIHHIPKVCYHWRQAPGSTAVHPDQKNYVESAAMKALRESAERRHIQARVVPVENMPTTYRYQYKLTAEPRVFIRLTDLTAATQFNDHFRAHTSYQNYELATDPLTGLPKDAYVLFLDAALQPESDDWLSELVTAAIQPNAGAVGAWIRRADTRTVEAGYVLEGEWARPLFAGALPQTWYHNGHALWPRNLLAVSSRCLLVSTANLAAINPAPDPMPEQLLNLCLRLHQAGRLNTFWPYAKLQAADTTTADPVKLTIPGSPTHDPYLSPNLTLRHGELELKP